MKKVIDVTSNTITFKFNEGLADVTVYASKLSEPMKDYSVIFGIGHRCGDNAAPEKTETARRAAVIEMAEHMQSGTIEWNIKGGTRAAPQNPTILAIAAKFGITYEAAQAKIAEQFLAEIA